MMDREDGFEHFQVKKGRGNLGEVTEEHQKYPTEWACVRQSRESTSNNLQPCLDPPMYPTPD